MKLTLLTFITASMGAVSSGSMYKLATYPQT